MYVWCRTCARLVPVLHGTCTRLVSLQPHSRKILDLQVQQERQLQVVCEKQLPGTVELLRAFKMLLGRYNKKLAAHTEKGFMDPAMCATQWLCVVRCLREIFISNW